jgi:gamma-glutamyltranspeptidase/glutathione hydrolase
MNLTDFTMPLDQAINAPRIHLEGSRLDVEKGFESEIALDFSCMFEDSKIWSEKNFFFGGVNAVGYDAGKKDLWAASDPRLNGCVVVLG